MKNQPQKNYPLHSTALTHTYPYHHLLLLLLLVVCVGVIRDRMERWDQTEHQEDETYKMISVIVCVNQVCECRTSQSSIHVQV